jgi:hypothetical protein
MLLLLFKGSLFRQNLLKGVLNLDFCAVKINGLVSVIDTNEFAFVLCNGFQHFAVMLTNIEVSQILMYISGREITGLSLLAAIG